MAAHVLGMLAWAERSGRGALTSEYMASSIDTNPVVVRRIVGDLHRAGLVETRRGPGGGVVLARPPETVTLREAYEAVTAEGELLGGYPAGGPNRKCPIAGVMADYLDEVTLAAEQAMLAELGESTLLRVADRIRAQLGDGGG